MNRLVSPATEGAVPWEPRLRFRPNQLKCIPFQRSPGAPSLTLSRSPTVPPPMFGRSCQGLNAFTPECNGETYRWVSTTSAVALMLMKNSGVRKSLLIPVLALQLPQIVVSYMRSEYGLWTAFAAVLARLFYMIPGDFELPLSLLLLIITAPRDLLAQRTTQAGVLVWATVASYMGFQHFSKVGGFKRAFSKAVLVPTLAHIVLVTIPVMFLIQGY